MAGIDGVPKLTNAWDDLIEALTIMRKYNPETSSPTHCEHDTLYVMVDSEDISPEDLARLEELHFTPDWDVEAMSSSWFGSA